MIVFDGALGLFVWLAAMGALLSLCIFLIEFFKRFYGVHRTSK